jgi:Sulfotransferase family
VSADAVPSDAAPGLQPQPGAVPADGGRSQPPPGVIVAGMHRSGTSLVASTLVARGWHAPGPMLEAGRGNRRGHFEDRRMHDLHRRLLEAHHTAWDLGPQLRRLRRQPLSVAKRDDLVAPLVAAFRQSGPWMWKNPRATLFLESWAQRFPEAFFVICVRSPGSVVDSMWRRGDRLRIGNRGRFHRVRRTARMLSVWHSYNLIAYRFARAHRDRVAIVRIPEDLPTVAAAVDPPLFDPTLMRERARPAVRLAAASAVSSQLLYYRLRRLHDPARLSAVLAGPSASESSATTAAAHDLGSAEERGAWPDAGAGEVRGTASAG